jgi:hypothetical protein
MLAYIVDDLKLFFLLGILFFKELLLELFDVLTDFFEHSSDFKFIIRQVINKDCGFIFLILLILLMLLFLLDFLELSLLLLLSFVLLSSK